MPYVFVRESVFKWWVAVQGLSQSDLRLLGERLQEQPEQCNERERRAEFSLPSWQVLNSLEIMGYKVVSCGCYMTGEARHDQREFVWTLHRARGEWEN